MSNWTGNDSRKARQYWDARLAVESLPCSRCGEPVYHGEQYDVDHLVALSDGGDPGIDNTWPAHSSCNRRHGQHLSAISKARTRGTHARVHASSPVFEASTTTLARPPARRSSRGEPDLTPAHLSRVPDQVDLSSFEVGCEAIGIEPKAHQGEVASVLLSGIYRRVAVCEPRRCGKTVGLWAVVVGICLTRPGTLCAFTAQSQLKAGDRFRDLVDRLTKAGTTGWTPRYAAGRQAVLFANGSRIDIRAPKGDSFRGDEADIVWIDEGQEFDLAVSQDLLGAVLPLFDTRPQALLIVSGTAGERREGLLWGELERGRQGKGGIVEYAAADDADLSDESVWWETHPGLASGMTTIEVLRERYDDLDPVSFGREYAGQWPTTASTSLIDPDQWASLGIDEAVLPADGSVVLAWDTAPDASSAALLAAWRDFEHEDLVVAQVLRVDAGTHWVAEEVHSLVRSLKASVVYDAIGPSIDIAEQLVRRRTPRVEALRSGDLRGGYAALLERIKVGNLRHVADERLDDAVAEAERRPFGESFLWRRTPGSAPLVALTHAAWWASQRKRKTATRIRSAS